MKGGRALKRMQREHFLNIEWTNADSVGGEENHVPAP